MEFSRLIVHNVERESLEEAPRFVYVLTANDDEERGSNHFNVAEIFLLKNGWVKIVRHDGGTECFPPNRVVSLEDWVNG